MKGEAEGQKNKDNNKDSLQISPFSDYENN